MCIYVYTLDIVFNDLRECVSLVKKSAARVKLILDQCLQNKAFATVYIYCKINMLLQCYSDVTSSAKRINNII